MGRDREEFRSSGVQGLRCFHSNGVESYANRKRQKKELRRQKTEDRKNPEPEPRTANAELRSANTSPRVPNAGVGHRLQVSRIRGMIFVSDKLILAVTPELLRLLTI
jgi:hypothetical protein